VTATAARAAETFALEFPTEPVHVATARIFAAALARAYGIDEDTVEEIKIGISEACGIALRAATPASGPGRIEAERVGDRLTFEVSVEVPADWPGPEADATDTPTPTGPILSREMLSALFPDARTEAGENGRGIVSFSVEIPPEA
jgi:hypothetical protein